MVVLTPEAVAAALTRAGFTAAQVDEYWHRPVTEGFTVFNLPVTHEDRVAVSWNTGTYEGDLVHKPHPQLSGCAISLQAAGYQTEFVADIPEGYLAVWVDGEF